MIKVEVRGWLSEVEASILEAWLKERRLVPLDTASSRDLFAELGRTVNQLLIDLAQLRG